MPRLTVAVLLFALASSLETAVQLLRKGISNTESQVFMNKFEKARCENFESIVAIFLKRDSVNAL